MSTRKIIALVLALVLIVPAVYYLWTEQQLPGNTKIDHLLVLKSKRELQVYSRGKLIKVYTISLGGSPVGDKQYEGDNKTPEGIYTINDKNPNSGYHKNLGVSYPDSTDLQQAIALGKPAGGDIKIHGLRNGTGIIGKFHRWHDWTKGCIAVTNAEIDELYKAVPIGTTIEIRP